MKPTKKQIKAIPPLDTPLSEFKGIGKYITIDEFERLREGYRNDLSLNQIWLDTQIDYNRLMDFLASGVNKQLLDRERAWPTLQATKLFNKAAAEDPNHALKLLERRDKDNWSSRSELTGKDGEALIPKPIMDLTK